MSSTGEKHSQSLSEVDAGAIVPGTRWKEQHSGQEDSGVQQEKDEQHNRQSKPFVGRRDSSQADMKTTLF